MALLKLPLALSSDGFLERAKGDEDNVAPRIRFFLYSGMGEFGYSSRRKAASLQEVNPGTARKGSAVDMKKEIVKRLREQGIHAVWGQLHVMTPTSRLSSLFEGDDGDSDYRKALEDTIRKDLNSWLEGIAVIEAVRLLPYKDSNGDRREKNGISISTNQMDYTFIFEYASSASGRGLVGSWNIREDFHGRY
jgi:hypothetical protein